MLESSTMQIAVLLATYNGSAYLREQLDSLLAQSFTDFVCYIHDDGSADNTLEICREYEHKFQKKFHILSYDPCGGAKKNFLSMMEYVTEPYVMFCDQDDVWHEDKIEKSYTAIKKAEEDDPEAPVLVFSDLRVVDQNLDVISDSFFKLAKKNLDDLSFNNLLIQGFAPGCTFIMNQRLYERLNDFKDIDKVYMHDWWAACLAVALGGKVSVVRESLIDYRQHSSNTLGIKRATCFTAAKHLLKDFQSGELLARKRAWVDRSRNMAYQLASVDGITEDCREFCLEMKKIANKSKLVRVAFYLSNFRGYCSLPYMLIWV